VLRVSAASARYLGSLRERDQSPTSFEEMIRFVQTEARLMKARRVSPALIG
jgi:hypothetical protein